nr:reverse transcriptase domain-containing protein [Tanacetum cinerariifolium]
MSTHSSARNLFSPLDNSELTIRRRPRGDPTLLNDFEMATNGNSDDVPPPGGGDLPVPDLQTMDELCQPTLNGQGRTFMKRRPEECYDLIENMTAHHNDWDTSVQKSESSSSITSSSDLKIVALKAEMAEINKNLMKVLQINQQNIYVAGAYNQGGNSYQPQGTLPSNTITNPKEDLKCITTRSGIAYKGPTIPTTYSPLKVVERKTEVINDTMPPTNNGSTKDVQPPVVQIETQVPNSEPVVAPVVKPIVAPVSALKPNPKSSIPYPSRLHDQKLHDKTNDQKEIFFQIFQDLNFNISFTDALIRMLKFGLTIKSLLTNKDKLFELARTLLSEHCLAVLLKKLPEKLGDPGKSLISQIDFLTGQGRRRCLRKSRNTGRALIDVYEGELTLRVGNKAITFNLDQTLRYFANYDVMSVNRIDIIDVACEEYSQEVLRFFGDILLLEEFLNDDPSSPPLPPQELKVVEPKNKKSSIDEPPMVELKDLSPHLEYAFLEGDDKLPIIIAKDLKDKEKTTLIKVLKSHKQALAWQLSYIKGINPEFCTHKILMEDDFKPAVQHQRRSLGDPHPLCSKKGGFIVVENEENKLFPTRLVTGWREISHFMVKEGIVLGHKISKNMIEVDKAKVDVIAKLPHPTTVKGICGFLGHAGFYRRSYKIFGR